MSGAIGVVNDDNFESEVLESQVPVFVDYWASWCQPCMRMMPIIEQIATEYEDKIKVVKLNVEENPLTVERFSIRGIPTFMLFIDGNSVVTKVGGNLSKSQLAQLIDNNL